MPPRCRTVSTRPLGSDRRVLFSQEAGLCFHIDVTGPVNKAHQATSRFVPGTIAGAAVDVFEQEPVDPDNPILKLDNVAVAPHIAGKSYESYPRRVRFDFENMVNVWQGGKPESIVSTE